MRPGRLDRILYVGPPDQSGREEILRIKIKNMSVEDNIDIGGLANAVSLRTSDDMNLLDLATVSRVFRCRNHRHMSGSCYS